MNKQSIVFWMAILATLLYSSHWIAEYYEHPQARLLKFAALFPFLVGVIFFILDWRDRNHQDHE